METHVGGRIARKAQVGLFEGARARFESVRGHKGDTTERQDVSLLLILVMFGFDSERSFASISRLTEGLTGETTGSSSYVTVRRYISGAVDVAEQVLKDSQARESSRTRTLFYDLIQDTEYERPGRLREKVKSFFPGRGEPLTKQGGGRPKHVITLEDGQKEMFWLVWTRQCDSPEEVAAILCPEKVKHSPQATRRDIVEAISQVTITLRSLVNNNLSLEAVDEGFQELYKDVLASRSGKSEEEIAQELTGRRGVFLDRRQQRQRKKKKEELTSEQQGCAHYWVIDRPNGPTSKGVCRICGAEGEFENSIPGTTWDGPQRRAAQAAEASTDPDLAIVEEEARRGGTTIG